ncbi:MAG TPA: agmatinase family protein [Actinomycetota bacterium]|nr:agmatinase family protein [Actinomycetota bacterium]
MAEDPNWPRASAWLAGDHLPEPVGTLAVLGAPLHLGSITPGRCDLAPAAIRKALERYSTYDADTGVDLRRLVVSDLGDVDVADSRPEEALAPLSEGVRSALDSATAVAVLGGDNSVTRPGCHGTAQSLDRLGLVTLDAHHDLRDLDEGLSNGNPVRALLSDGLPGENIVQVGIAPFANSPAYAEVATKAGITVVTVDAVRERGIDAAVSEALEALAERADRIYVDLDIDVLDRAFAPGSPGSRPGGLTPWEVQRAAGLCGRHAKVNVIDIVEVDPSLDVSDVTALSAARCVLSFASGVAVRLTSQGPKFCSCG